MMARGEAKADVGEVPDVVGNVLHLHPGEDMELEIAPVAGDELYHVRWRTESHDV